MLVLKKGDKGKRVENVQKALHQLGFDIGKSGADGIFGGDTESAVIAFQQQRGLKSIDGKAGEETLTALGLDIHTAELVGHQTNVDFSKDETIPPIVMTRINEYVSLVLKYHNDLLNRSQEALDQFETTMTFASNQEAKADISGAFASAVYDVGVSKLIDALGSRGIVLSLAKSAYEKVTAEIDRADQASTSTTVGSWIKNQSRLFESARDKLVKPNALQEEIALRYLDVDDRGHFFAELVALIDRFNENVLPSLSEVELSMYEQWINGHFSGLTEDTPTPFIDALNVQGCIEYRNMVVDDGFKAMSCLVKAPFGDKVSDALNDLLRQRLVPRFGRRNRSGVTLFRSPSPHCPK